MRMQSKQILARCLHSRSETGAKMSRAPTRRFLDQARALVMALESPVGIIYSLLIAEVIGTPLR